MSHAVRANRHQPQATALAAGVPPPPATLSRTVRRMLIVRLVVGSTSPLAVATLRIPKGWTAVPFAETEAKARVMSISRTSEVPSTIEGFVAIGVVTPNRRAMAATAPKPTSLPSFAATVFFE